MGLSITINRFIEVIQFQLNFHSFIQEYLKVLHYFTIHQPREEDPHNIIIEEDNLGTINHSNHIRDEVEEEEGSTLKGDSYNPRGEEDNIPKEGEVGSWDEEVMTLF